MYYLIIFNKFYKKTCNVIIELYINNKISIIFINIPIETYKKR